MAGEGYDQLSAPLIMETIKCNICGSSEQDILYEIPDYLLDRDGISTTLVKCPQCGLIFQNPRPTIEEMDIHYPPEYDSYLPASEQIQGSWLMSKAINYGIYKRCKVVREQVREGDILDIGCATGEFLRGMSNYPGWKAYGVEPNHYAANLARQRYGLEVFNGTLEKAAYPNDSFDVVTLWDVFEHLHDPTGTLVEIHRILKTNGVVIVRVPNAYSWDARWFGRYWAGLDAPRHLYVFEPMTLSRIFTMAGFEVNKFECRIGSYPTFVLSLRFWMVGNGIKKSTINASVRVLQHPIARIITAPIFYLTSIGLKGPLITLTVTKR